MNNNSAFILMPFSEPLNEVYEFLIKGALISSGYHVRRADDIKSQSNILEDIVKGILDSDLIVADLTNSNSNVYYELGIAHALQKKVILITQEISELPFDLRSYRVIEYSTHFAKMNQARSELELLAKEALLGNVTFGNPVKDFGYASNVKELIVSEPIIVSESESDLGLLDYIIRTQDDFERLAEIVNSVTEKLGNELNAQIAKATAMLTGDDNTTAKDKRSIIKELAKYVGKFVEFLIPQNVEYRILNSKLEKGIEMVLTNDLYSKDEIDSIEGIEAFIDGFVSLENGAKVGRDGFVKFLTAMSNIPNLEKDFNSANKLMQTELEKLLGNIDQTIAMSSRAQLLGNALLNKLNEKPE